MIAKAKRKKAIELSLTCMTLKNVSAIINSTASQQNAAAVSDNYRQMKKRRQKLVISLESLIDDLIIT